MVDWSTPGPITQLIDSIGWSTDGPATPNPAVGNEWFSIPSRILMDSGLGNDLVIVVPDLVGPGDGLGSSLAHLVPKIVSVGSGLGSSLAETWIKPVGSPTSGLGSDIARLGLRGTGSAFGSDKAGNKLIVPGRGDSFGNDWALVKPIILAPGNSVGNGLASLSRFSPVTATITQFSTSGSFNFTIPVWCRYIDIVLVGAGGGGEGGGWAVDGKGGQGGQFAVITLERGVDIPWSQITISGTIGTGGSGGAGGASPGAGTPGGNTVVTGILTAIGGTNKFNSSHPGLSPGTQNYQGRDYNGGAVQNTKGASGNPPGGGGAGGLLQWFAGQAGGPGAPGGAWFCSRQS